MITEITGAPGSGKTLYTVSDIIKKLIGTTVTEIDDDGNEIVHERKIYSNINGLRLPHELIDARSDGGLGNWHEWAEPGSMIIYDEVQKAWPLRPNGSAVPPNIQALDTHRHMGVDFVLLTQTVNNVDRHIQGLVGRHLHLRKIGNWPMAIVYEWDHCSKALQYSKAIAKKFWWYSRGNYKLYKSARVHTKVERKTPTLVWFILIGLCVAGWGGPAYYERMKQKTQGGAIAATVEDSKHVATPAKNDHPKPAAAGATQSHQQAAVAAPVEPDKPVFAGCIASAVQCLCFTDRGQQIEPEPGQCQAHTAKPKVVLAGGGVDWYPDPVPPPKPELPRWTGTVIGTEKGWRF